MMTPSREPRVASHRAPVSKIDFGPPMAAIDPALLGSERRQRFMCPRDGCYDHVSHEHNEVTNYAAFRYTFVAADEFRGLLGSQGDGESTGGSRKNVQHGSLALVDLLKNADSRDTPLAWEFRHAELPMVQDGNLREASPAHQEDSDNDSGSIVQEYNNLINTTNEITRSSSGIFQVDRPVRVDKLLESPGYVSPYVPPILYGGPARPEQCTSHTCPVREIHGVGLYVHDSQWGTWPNDTFGISNPPDYVWAAQARIALSYASQEDIEMVWQFVMHHDRPYPGA